MTMNDIDKTQDIEVQDRSREPQKASATDNKAEQTERPNPRAKFGKFAIIGIILAIAAWIVLSFEGRVAWAISIMAIISSCIGLKAPTRTLRNTAITAIIASAVLLIVVSAFLLIFLIGLK